MIPKRLLIPLLLVLISPAGFAQNSNLTGIWEGRYLSSYTDLGAPKLVVEIYNFKDSTFTGITHLYYRGNKYEHYKMVGWYRKKDSSLVFREASTIAVDLGVYGNCLGTYTMILKKNGNKLVLYGLWRPNIYACTQDSRIYLEKNIEEIKETPEPPIVKRKETPEPPIVKRKETPPPVVKRNEPVKRPVSVPDTVKRRVTTPVITTPPVIPVVKAPPVIKTNPTVVPEKVTKRETDVQSLVEIASSEKDSIRVDIYDNAEIDGDTVSVYEGKTLRVDRKMISTKPITFFVSLNKNINPITHLRLVAESLGSIPPCTALMIVTTKSKRYEVHLSSNFSKNATVELFLKE